MTRDYSGDQTWNLAYCSCLETSCSSEASSWDALPKLDVSGSPKKNQKYSQGYDRYGLLENNLDSILRPLCHAQLILETSSRGEVLRSDGERRCSSDKLLSLTGHRRSANYNADYPWCSSRSFLDKTFGF